jgi:hypothetical protein
MRACLSDQSVNGRLRFLAKCLELKLVLVAFYTLQLSFFGPELFAD